MVQQLVAAATNNNEAGREREETATPPSRWPLSSKYKTSTGIYQSLSLILNAGLMVYAHYGLSAVFVSNQRNIPGAVDAAAKSSSSAAESPTMSSTTTTTTAGNNNNACSASDQERWTSVIGPCGLTGAYNKSVESSYCSTGYTNPDTQSLCLIDEPCITKCFTTLFNYTTPCAECFAAIPLCSLTDGCTSPCSRAPQSEECYNCTLRCNEIFQNCSGLSIALTGRPWEVLDDNCTTNNSNDTAAPVDAVTMPLDNAQVCAVQKEGVDYQDTVVYHTVFKVLFFQSMDIAWKNNARLLAVIVVAFSLVWPYTKNVILMFAWYWPMTEHTRTHVLLWLRRLGKYTLIDVYVILILIIGVVLEINLNGVPVVSRGEPRPAILAFLVATLWEFVHIEWMVLFHQRTIDKSMTATTTDVAVAANRGNLAYAIRFRGLDSTGITVQQFRHPVLLRCFLAGLLLIAVALFAVGSTLDLVRFQTTLAGDEIGCVRTYNLWTFPNIALSDLVLDRNEAVYGIWTLVVSFLVFVLAVPWFVHFVHAMAFWLGLKSRMLFVAADACWTFSCGEVFLIALFILEQKFKQLVDRLAGEEGAALFEVSSELGLGFYVLIAYTICGGFVHHFFSNAVSEYYALDPHHKVNVLWTVLFGPALTKVVDAVVVEQSVVPSAAETNSEEPIHRRYIAEEDAI